MIALRTQQIVAYESGLADVVDPLAGSYYVEAMTNRIEKEAWDYIKKSTKLAAQYLQLKKVISRKKFRIVLTNGKWMLNPVLEQLSA